MARNGVASWRRKSEKPDLSPPLSSEEAHVLAVDDSLVDRKVIERLLKISSCKGRIRKHSYISWKRRRFFVSMFLNWIFLGEVTTVDSGRRALQLLGLDDEKSSTVGFDVSSINDS